MANAEAAAKEKVKIKPNQAQQLELKQAADEKAPIFRGKCYGKYCYHPPVGDREHGANHPFTDPLCVEPDENGDVALSGDEARLLSSAKGKPLSNELKKLLKDVSDADPVTVEVEPAVVGPKAKS